MLQRNQLIQLIHVGKRELAIDDDTYRDMLEAETSKTSCSTMSIAELETVLTAMEQRGFKRRLKGNQRGVKKRLSPKSGKARHAEIDKIRAIWITMNHHGFVRDGSETALDKYVRRLTGRSRGDGVEHVGWCNETQAYSVLESLKSWHRRVMVDALKEQHWTVPRNEKTGQPMGYEQIAFAYEHMREAIQ